MRRTTLVLAASLLIQVVPGAQSGIADVVAVGVEPELVQDGFVWLEGPLGTADGGLLFSEIRGANRIHRLDPSGKITTLHEGTNGANGLAFTRSGDLLAAEGDGKRISRRGPDGRLTVITETGPKGPFQAPNDVIADAKGGIYFTDPAPRPVVPGRNVYVYYLPAGAKEPRIVDDQITRPNGLTITTDNRTLLVDDTVGDTVYAFDVLADGAVTNKRAFARLHDLPNGPESGADGMAVDRNGRVYVATALGVQVFDRIGKYLGTIRVPHQPANIAFAGPGKRTLYITAHEGRLYRLRMLAQGPDRLGK